MPPFIILCDNKVVVGTGSTSCVERVPRFFCCAIPINLYPSRGDGGGGAVPAFFIAVTFPAR